MLARRINTTEDKIVLRYEKSGDKLGLLPFSTVQPRSGKKRKS
jgi:hypothetical protein